MKIPTVTEIRKIMADLEIEQSHLAKALGVSKRTTYRMTSTVDTPSKKDRAAVSFVLYEFSKEKRIETILSLKKEVFCECEEPEKYESSLLGYPVCLSCNKRIKEEGNNENQD